MDDRKGFLTPEEEEQVDALVDLKGILEIVDGPAIRVADNTGLQKVKEKLLKVQPEAVPIIYSVIDEIFSMLPSAKVLKEMAKKNSNATT